MKVILTQDIKELGKKDQIVNVSDGYAKNYLIPRKMAKPATEGAVNEAKEKQRAQNEKKARELAIAKEQAAKLKDAVVDVKVKVGENGKLFGAVSNKDVADALRAQHGIDVDKKKIEISETIKYRGRFKCTARIYPSVSADFDVNVIPE